ncbi:MAG: 2-keto-4-pentenoate hydratase [Candidatus Tectimicrobiota bacterium]
MSIMACSRRLACLLLFPWLAQAACPDQAAVAAYVADVQAARLSQGFGNTLSLEEAACARGKLVQALPPVLGPVVGYKAGFTNPVLQQRFGVSGPAWGVMFAGLMRASGARLPARFGARPLYEADLVVVVKDAGLADASTPLEALQYLAEVAPFIELPDLMLDGTPSGSALIATNIAFRGGVLGPRLPVVPTPAFLDALATMTVVLSEDRQGKELGRAPGSALMEHPLNAALWIARALKQDGILLRPGDLLSLGGYFPPAPTQPGSSITVTYRGLPGDPSVTVHFE